LTSRAARPIIAQARRTTNYHSSRLRLLAIIAAAALPIALTAANPKPASLFSLSGLGPRESVLEPSFGGGVDAEETLHFDGTNVDGIGLTSGGTYTGAVRFTPTTGCALKAILFFQYQGSSDDKVYAWGAGTSTTPGATLDSQPYIGAGDSVWKRIDFAAPIPVGANDDFWLGVEVTHEAGVNPLGVDAGPMAVDRGGFIYFSGSWSQLADYGLDYNWNIRAIISTATLDRDVGVAKVLPVDRIRPGDAVTFAATVKNYGSDPATFPVHYSVYDSLWRTCLIEGDTTIYHLRPGAVTDFIIGAARPDYWGVYLTTVTTSLTGDENSLNDARAARAMCRTGSEPDGFGYIYESTQDGDSVTFNWIDPTAGTPITSWQGTRDDGYATCYLPFPFRYYEQDLTSINICTNGFLETGTATTYSNAAFPQSMIPNLIALFWDDLNPGAGGTVYQYNSPTNDYAIFAFVNVPPYSGIGTLTAEVILDNQGRIRMNYLQVLPQSNSSTTGIQGLTGTGNWFQQYIYNGAPYDHTPASDVSVLYSYPRYMAIADSHARTVTEPPLNLPAPYLSGAVPLPSSLGRGTAQVVGLDGRVLRSVELTGSDEQLSLAGFSPGVYFLRLATTRSHQTRKLILAR
jgi:hypothetical protein